MRVDGFASSLVFGAVAAVSLVFTLHLMAPLVGPFPALALHLAASLVAYAAALGGSLRTGLRNALLAAAGAALVVALAEAPRELAVGLAGVLGLVRTGLAPGRPGARGALLEIVLALAGLGFAAWLASPGWLGSATALWGFALVQSLWFLAPRSAARASRAEPADAFERARDRLLELLEEG